MIFIAASNLTLSGSITADGGTGSSPSGGYKGGGGSGGSIRIEVVSLNMGAGTVSSTGGAPSGINRDGAVGLIAIYYENPPSFTAPSTDPSAYYYTLTSTPTPTPMSTATPAPWGSGADGDLTVASGETFNIHTESDVAGRVCIDGGDAVSYLVTALTASSATLYSSPNSGCLSAGDELMLINISGIPGEHTNVGNYEFLRVGTVSGDTVYFSSVKTLFYGDNADDDSNIGVTHGTNQSVMLMRTGKIISLT